jgi:hypothetical protein
MYLRNLDMAGFRSNVEEGGLCLHPSRGCGEAVVALENASQEAPVTGSIFDILYRLRRPPVTSR